VEGVSEGGRCIEGKVVDGGGRVGTVGSVPKRPVRTIVRTMGRQSGQSGHGFEKPGSVRLKLSTAAKACRRPGNRRVERIGDRQMPRQSHQMPRQSRQMPR